MSKTLRTTVTVLVRSKRGDSTHCALGCADAAAASADVGPGASEIILPECWINSVCSIKTWMIQVCRGMDYPGVTGSFKMSRCG